MVKTPAASLTMALLAIYIVQEMAARSKTFLVTGLSLVLIAGIVLAIRLARVRMTPEPIVVEGSVLVQNIDPGERTPLPGVKVKAFAGDTTVETASDPTGYFKFALNSQIHQGATLTLKFQKADFKDVEITTNMPGQSLYIVQMQPVEPPSKTKPKPSQPSAAETVARVVTIKNLRVRYSSKDVSTNSIGSFAKQFAALNNGNVACRNQQPCSPDGKWKATVTTLPLDADAGNEFSNVRVSCIAGPCHFTRIDSDALESSSRQMTVSVLNWSDTTDFLVEADVVRTVTSDIVRQSYPFTLGDTMNFALPSNAEGPSIEADLDSSYIVFPLGPDLILSWATCSEEISADKNKLYRCRLKPGYRFE